MDIGDVLPMINKAVRRVTKAKARRAVREEKRWQGRLLTECESELVIILHKIGLVEAMLPAEKCFSDAAVAADGAPDGDDEAWAKRVAAEAIYCGLLKEIEAQFRDIKIPSLEYLADKYPPGSQFTDGQSE